MGWPPKFNQSFRRVRIGFCFERGDWWVEVRCNIERFIVSVGFSGVLSIITSGTRDQIK